MNCRTCNLVHAQGVVFYLAVIPNDPPFQHSVICQQCHAELQEDHDNGISSFPAVTIPPSIIKPNGFEPSRVSVNPIEPGMAVRETLERHGIAHH